MITQTCYYCGHLLPSDGQACVNCGAPPAVFSTLPTLPLSAPQTQPFFAPPLAGDPAPSLPGERTPVRHTAGLLGSRAGAGLTVVSAAGSAAPPAERPVPTSAKHTAALEGKVDTPPSRSSVDVPLEWWSQGALRFFFRPLFYLLSHRFLVVQPENGKDQPKQIKTTMTVCTVRVRRDDQSLGEARLEGDIIEGEPSLGDWVALYGHYRGSMLIVDEGYNLSFSPAARIKVRPPLPLTRMRVAVLTLAALLLIIFGLFLSFLPLFGYHSGPGHSLIQAAQYLQQHYLVTGSAFGLLSFTLFSLSGWLIRGLLLLLVGTILLAVYSALGGAGLPPLPTQL